MIILRLMIASMIVLLAGCQSTGVTVDNQLELEGAWHIETINGQSVVNYSPAQLYFNNNGVLSGNNSCNTFTGHYTFTGDALTLVPEAGTTKACVDALESQEKQVMSLMPNVTQANLIKTQLLLQNKDDKTLFILKKIPIVQSDELSGKEK
ncbi:META domain-containing protein [uncultured Shewanella sp.]|uniref:META domain-containing protein n=1 Tax=uncultured Shewanella sp. TaxID=173975 RepID=UPI002634918D|nr:META domain-containing protein [uncultured Shewanella sp.]